MENILLEEEQEKEKKANKKIEYNSRGGAFIY